MGAGTGLVALLRMDWRIVCWGSVDPAATFEREPLHGRTRLAMSALGEMKGWDKPIGSAMSMRNNVKRREEDYRF